MQATEGMLCWTELPARDIKKVYKFYKAAFPGWQFTPDDEPVANSEGKYTPIMIRFCPTVNKDLGGGIVPMPEGCSTEQQPMGVGSTSYFFVDSIEETIPRIEKLGGKLVLPKTDQEGHGWFANLIDIEGHRFGIFEVNKDAQHTM